MLRYGGNGYSAAPGCAAICGPEGRHGAENSTRKWDYNCSVRLHQRLSPNAVSKTRRAERWPPREATITRCIHLHQIGGGGVVPLDVAVAVERTCRGVVANDPVLVRITCRRDRNWIPPVDSVRRTADHHLIKAGTQCE